MSFASGDIFVYNGTQWLTQPSLPGPFDIDSPTFHVDNTNHRVGIGTTSPNSSLQVAAPIVSAFHVGEGGYTLTEADSVVYVYDTSYTCVINLPSPSGFAGRRYTIKIKGSGFHDIVVQSWGGETIDGQDRLTYGAGLASLILVSNGSNWDIIGQS
jgi:hypothetical protein